MNQKKKVCIAGKNAIAVDAMRYIYSDFQNEVELYVLPNKSDKGISQWQPSLRNEAKLLGIPVVELDDCYLMDGLLFISLEYDRIIKPELFCSGALYNIHFSMLPKYKGMYTSAWPILNGDSTSGVTLHEIDSGIDTGAIVGQVEFPILGMSCRDLYFAYMENAQVLFRSKFKDLLSGEITSMVQEAIGATYYPKSSIKYDALDLDFFATAFQVCRQFRAYSFREFQLPRYKGMNLGEAEILSTRSKLRPGQLVFRDEERLIVATVDYDVELKIDFLGQLIRLAESLNLQGLNEVFSRVKDLNELGPQGWNALMVAAFHNNLEAVKALVANGSSLGAVNCNGTTILMYAKDGAERAKDLTVLQWLLENGADIEAVDQRGKTVIDYCLENDQQFTLDCLRAHQVL